MHNTLKFLTITTISVIMAACVVSPDPITEEDRIKRANNDREKLFSGQEALKGPLSIGEAVARALKYNLDHKVKIMEEAVASREIDRANYDLLPDLTASAGYSKRDNVRGSTSVDAVDQSRGVTLRPSTSEQREIKEANLEFVWNVMDFGLSYITATQQADAKLISEQRRRKVMQNIFQDVLEAYWKAWTAQELNDRIVVLLDETDDVLTQSRKLIKQNKQNKKRGLSFQRNLLETRSAMWEVRERMALAQTRLATLMNLNPTMEYSLQPPDALSTPTQLGIPLEQLEQAALVNRPELAEEDYLLRIAHGDVRKALLNLFPRIEFNSGLSWNSNKFLLNESWGNIGATVVWNVFDIFRYGADKSVAEAEVELAETRRLALSMAVITQVNLAINRYELARSRYVAAKELADVNSEYSSLVARSGNRESRFEQISSASASIVSDMRKNLAYSETQAAFGRVLNSVGVDILPKSVPSDDLEVLTESFDTFWRDLRDQYLWN